MSPMPTITPFLWLDGTVREAVAFYTSVFPDTRVESVSDFSATFELQGQRFHALNGGPHFRFTEAVSFYVAVETQDEVDRYWAALTAGGAPGRCGWLKDRFGLSWQVVPSALVRHLTNPDRAAAARAQQAMMGMGKIVIADLDAAAAG